MLTPKTQRLIIISTLLFSQHTAASCLQKKVDLQAKVTRVIDGDTVQIDNGARIRLIGVNTPETGHHGKPAEAGAETAKNALQDWLATSSNQVKLQFGQERHDRYGRLLAHVFLTDGRNINEQLLLNGHALHVAFPPNLWALDCYRASEARARQRNKKHWQSKITPLKSLDQGQQGFRLIRGKISDIGYSKKSIWLNFSPVFSARIARRDLDQFKTVDLQRLLHKTVLVRGWVRQQKNKRIVRLRHSSMLEIVK